MNTRQQTVGAVTSRLMNSYTLRCNAKQSSPPKANNSRAAFFDAHKTPACLVQPTQRDAEGLHGRMDGRTDDMCHTDRIASRNHCTGVIGSRKEKWAARHGRARERI